MFDIEIDKALLLINEKGYKKIGLQLPEGLKERGPELAKTITKETEAEVIIFGDPCYGACDLADENAFKLGCDALFHFGHSEIISKTKIPVHYVDVKLDIDPIPLISKNLEKLPRNIGLVTTIQHIHVIDKIASFLDDNGIRVTLGQQHGRALHEGQVLGCSFSTAKSIANNVEGFLYIGTGNFHPLGVAISTNKKTLALDLEKGELRDMDELKEPILRRRFAAIAKTQDAKSFGIIIGEKQGQKRSALARKLKELIQSKGKTGYLIALQEINPDTIIPFRKLDAFVNTACPRIVIDDAGGYKKPILTPVELEIVLGLRDWEDYSMDEIN
jgi:2-(3-amino-3-carboxypropyl)histidine synthase